MKFKTRVLFFYALIVFAVGCSSKKEASLEGAFGMGPAEVDVALPLKKKIVDLDTYTGRFESTDEVKVRARVTGYLDEIRFQDGQFVEKGDILFMIDPRPFEYARERAQAQYVLAQKEYQRAENLLKSSAISAEDFDRRLQELKVAEVHLKEADLDLEFTQVKAPISGKASRDFVNVGNLVRADDTILTRIVTFDPIHFYFEASQNQLLKYLRLDRAGKRPGSDRTANPIYIKLPDEKDFVHEGKMDFVDNIIDPSTGTILGRAIVPNPDKIIYPGLFGRARLVGSGEYEAILIPDTSINTDQSRKFVYIVDQENKAKRAYIELGPMRESGFYVVRSGLKGDERVVIRGIQRILSEGQSVIPQEAPLSEPSHS